VKVDDAVENVTVMLARDPVREGSEIVAEMHWSGGLDTRQNA
jgi:hypothetical protein